VSSSATRDEIRVAYRRLARQHHPDAKGDASVERMSQINEAWRVLSDPGRRAVYDAQSRGSAASRASNVSPNASPAAGVRTTPRPTVVAQAVSTPARFPWRFMLVVATLGIGFVLVNAALTKQDTRDVPDNLINAGSCVNVVENGDAIEVSCGGTHDGVVDSLISFGSVCPSDTETHRDRQGMGQVCVRLIIQPAGG
jgi:molecular chaperone DnaJ